MILGIGIDLLKVSRIKRILDQYGNFFLNKVFTNSEINSSKNFVSKENKFAKSFATKEAFVKALGTGFKKGVSFKDISVKNFDSGQPFLHLSKDAKRELIKKTPKGYTAIVNVSISDEKDYVISNVIISLKKN